MKPYVCINSNCSFPGKNRFEMAFNEESIMDEQNLASVFCPFCKKEMIPQTFMDTCHKPEFDKALVR